MKSLVYWLLGFQALLPPEALVQTDIILLCYLLRRQILAVREIHEVPLRVAATVAVSCTRAGGA